jgi:hypothetical protein
VRAGNAAPRTFIRNTTGPSKSGCANWSTKRVENCARPRSRPSGPPWNKTPSPAAGPKPRTCAAWSKPCGPKCPNAVPKKGWSSQDLADYAATLSQGQLRALGFRCDKHTGRVRCPGVTPFRDVLIGVDAAALERALLAWQEQLLGPAQDDLVIVDGKTLRHAHLELVSAVNGQGRWLGTLAVPEGSNEIPAARQLLSQVPVAHKTTLADALHTQLETAQQILFEGGGDYALTVKANQKGLVQTLTTLLTPGEFSPSAHAADPRADPGTQLQPPGDSPPGMSGSHAGASRFSRGPPDCAPATAGAVSRQKEHRNGLSDQQSDPGTT